jgi:hypothetical protein
MDETDVGGTGPLHVGDAPRHHCDHPLGQSVLDNQWLDW